MLALDDLPNVHIETSLPDHALPDSPWETVYVEHDRQRFRFCRWENVPSGAASSCSHVILLIHGLGGKPEWMSTFANFLLQTARTAQASLSGQLIIYAVDMPAYGAENPSGQGHIEDYRQLLDRLDACWQWLHTQHAEASFLPVGLSLGGLVLTHWAARFLERSQQLRQFALISPAYKASPVSFNPMFYAVVIGRFILEKLKLRPPGSLPLPYANDWTDPNIVRTLSVKGYWELLKMTLFATPGVLDRLKRRELPIWLGVAEKDTICDPHAMVDAYRQWPSPAKRLVVFPNAAHDLVLDPAMPAMAQDLIGWWKNLGSIQYR